MNDTERLDWIANHLNELTVNGISLVVCWWQDGEMQSTVEQYEGLLVNALRKAVDRAAGGGYADKNRMVR